MTRTPARRRGEVLPHGSVGPRAHRGQALVPQRNLPDGLVDFLAVEGGSFFLLGHAEPDRTGPDRSLRTRLQGEAQQ